MKARAGARYNDFSIAAHHAATTSLTPVFPLWRHRYFAALAWTCKEVGLAPRTIVLLLPLGVIGVEVAQIGTHIFYR